MEQASEAFGETKRKASDQSIRHPGKTVFVTTTRPLMLKALQAGLAAGVFSPEEKARAEKFAQRIRDHA